MFCEKYLLKMMIESQVSHRWEAEICMVRERWRQLSVAQGTRVTRAVQCSRLDTSALVY